MTVPAISQLFIDFQARLPCISQMQLALKNLISSTTSAASLAIYDISTDIAFFKMYDVTNGTGQEPDFVNHMNNIRSAFGENIFGNPFKQLFDQLIVELTSYIPGGNVCRDRAPATISSILTAAGNLPTGLKAKIANDLIYIKNIDVSVQIAYADVNFNLHIGNILKALNGTWN